MNETVNKFLLTVDKLKSEIHLQQPRFTYSACGTFTKKKTNSKIYRNRIFRTYSSK